MKFLIPGNSAASTVRQMSMRNHTRFTMTYRARFVAAGLALGLVAGTPSLAQSGNPFTGQQQPPPPTAPPIPVRIPDAAYDLARGAASPDNGGRGSWLPVISSAACSTVVRPPIEPPVPVPRPELERGSLSGGDSGGGGGRKKSVAKKPSTVTSPAAAEAGRASADTIASTAALDGASKAASGAGGAVVQAPATTAAPSSFSGLRAGSTDDNDRFDDYLSYRRKALTGGLFAHDLDVTERHVLRVVDDGGRPVLGARVDIAADDGTPLVDLRTMADGRTLFFPRLSSRPGSNSWTVRISGGGAETTARFDRSTVGHSFTLGGAHRADRVKLDVQFLIDTTGSMGDEIDRLRTNLLTISKSIAALPGQPDVRFAMTVYRDCGDEFLSRTYDFDGSVDRFNSQLATVRAAGGGDEPEALNQALHDAITRPGWRGDDTVKLVFLVADAPPHLDYPGDVDYALDTLLAARRGIKISPIASSGSNPQAEYVFRQLAQLTMAKFVFLTYGADGASPGDRTNLNVDAYETLALDQLVTRLAREEIAWQGPQAPPLPALPSGGVRTDAPIFPVAPPPVMTFPPPPFPPPTFPPPTRIIYVPVPAPRPCRYSARLGRCFRVNTYRPAAKPKANRR